MATPDTLVSNGLSRPLADGNCALCLLPLDLPYGVVVELVRNSITIRKVCNQAPLGVDAGDEVSHSRGQNQPRPFACAIDVRLGGSDSR